MTADLSQPVLWVYWPWFADALDLMPHSHVVVDLVDDYTGYMTTDAARRHMQRCVVDLIRRADRTIVTSPTLADLYSFARPAVVPNGYDEALFHAGVVPHPSLQDMRHIVGFVGTLFDFVDYDLLLQLAASLPDVDLVLVGRRETSSARVDELLRQPNVHWYGPVAPKEVPAYIAGFDVSIAPFRPGAVADSVSPLKVYEYLALRKPVICSRMKGLARDSIAKYVTFAPDCFGFIAAVKAALAGAADMPVGLADVMRDCTWSGRFAQVAAYVGDEVLRV